LFLCISLWIVIISPHLNLPFPGNHRGSIISSAHWLGFAALLNSSLMATNVPRKEKWKVQCAMNQNWPGSAGILTLHSPEISCLGSLALIRNNSKAPGKQFEDAGLICAAVWLTRHLCLCLSLFLLLSVCLSLFMFVSDQWCSRTFQEKCLGVRRKVIRASSIPLFSKASPVEF
jgi:hypothetical protein